ncbi:MAG: hypothetical protein HY378_00940 [Candidatus Brennerbacteria bacterium]|nr:hypothetical protein [Candidatus Brennerbacteria bacterium]
MNQETRVCQNCKEDFVIEPADFDFYKKISVPSPTQCPQCRMLRRWIWRNDRHLFRRKDAVSGKEIFSNFPPQVDAKIVDIGYWKSDAWDPLEYGRDYDFSRPFFEQFKELLQEVLWPSRSVEFLVNSDYCDQVGYLKNCYLCFNGDEAEDSAYCFNFSYLKNCFDLREAGWSELCYDSVIIGSSYRAFFTLNSENCRDSWFLKNCTGCTDCFGCVDLRNKSYHIWNQPHSKEDYFRKLKEFNLGSYESLRKLTSRAHEFWLKFPVKYRRGVRSVNSSGELIFDAKNAKNCYSVLDVEKLRYCQFAYRKATDCYDYSVWGNAVSEMYECMTCGEQSSRMKFCWEVWPGCNDVEYSMFCRASSNLFGCVGLRQKKYCIFNKQYSKEEYTALREKIVKQMTESGEYGEFFPPEFSPFAYNETICQDYFPLSAEAAAKAGYRWREPELRDFQTTIDARGLPDRIQDVKEDILKEIIKCASCGRAYRIITMELNFLKQIGIPLPRLCVNCRYTERFKNINPPTFWQRQCMCDYKTYNNFSKHDHHPEGRCPNEFETSYAPERPEIVYCEECYQKEVI